MPAESASDEPTGVESRGPGPGEQLRGAREKNGLSVEQVADQLHLDEKIIEALESEHFERVGAPVFVRGHLKAYARVLRIEAAPVLDAYRTAQPQEELDPVLARRAPPQPGRPINPGPWAVGVGGALVAVALVFYVFQDDEPLGPALSPAATLESGQDEGSFTPRTVPAPATTIPPSAPAPADPLEPAPAEPEPPVTIAPPPEVAMVPAAEPAVPVVSGSKLELYFRGESWVEIADREGRILVGLQREGMRRQLTGQPPFQVLLGNAPAVDVYLDGQPYTIPARNINGNVARFTIDPAAGGGAR